MTHRAPRVGCAGGARRRRRRALAVAWTRAGSAALAAPARAGVVGVRGSAADALARPRSRHASDASSQRTALDVAPRVAASRCDRRASVPGASAARPRSRLAAGCERLADGAVRAAARALARGSPCAARAAAAPRRAHAADWCDRRRRASAACRRVVEDGRRVELPRSPRPAPRTVAASRGRAAPHRALGRRPAPARRRRPLAGCRRRPRSPRAADAGRTRRTAARRHAAAAGRARAQVDLERAHRQVVRQIDRRIVAHRERAGTDLRSAMPLEQLQITVETHRRRARRCSSTPRSTPSTRTTTSPSRASPASARRSCSSCNGNQRTLEMELFFDTYDTPTLPKQDVRDADTAGRRPDGDRRRAPRAAGPAGDDGVAGLPLRAVARQRAVPDVPARRHAGPRAARAARSSSSSTPSRRPRRSTCRRRTSPRSTSSRRGETLSGIAAAATRTRSSGGRSRSRTASRTRGRSRPASRCAIPSLPVPRSRDRRGGGLRWPATRRTRPSFTVRINGEPLPTGAARRDHRASATRTASRAPTASSSTLANDGLRWLDHPLLQVDTPFALDARLRARSTRDGLRRRDHRRRGDRSPPAACPTVTVVAHDFLQRLTVGHQGPRVRAQPPLHRQVPAARPGRGGARRGHEPARSRPSTRSARRCRSSRCCSPTRSTRSRPKRAIRIQQGQSDFDFLSGLAKENGWEMYIDHTLEPQGLRPALPVPDPGLRADA